MRKRSLAIAILVICLITIAIFFTQVQAENDFFSELKLIIRVYQIVKNEYIEKVETSKLIEGAIRGMVESLNDPRSRWLSVEEYEEINVERKGEFGGLGMTVGIKDHSLVIVAPLDDTPASKAGLQAGDKIIKINGESTKNMSLDEAVSKLRGEVGTPVTITIIREGIEEPLEFTLTRALIKLPNVKYRILKGKIGYIKIIGFTNEETSRNLREALIFLKQEGVEALILDLRNNPGGLLSEAVKVADEFLSSGVIVSTRGRNPAQNEVYSAHPGGEGLGVPLVVLINRGSASASEIVAGAIKDHQRGIILGTTSFGKGTVQSVIPLEDGSAVTLTTAKYYTPSGVCIEGEGIKPDMRIEPFIPTSKEKELIDKLKNSEIVKNFLQKNPEWENQDLDKLIQALKEDGLEVKEELLERVLREEDGIEENDIYNDNQVTQAMALLKSLQILKKQILSLNETSTQVR